jgi:imidazoleglycerol-phosphate dehydratase
VSRTSEISRSTSETQVELALDLDGAGEGARSTGVGFFDHLLDALARHGGLDLDVRANGDLETGAHHTVEDTGIALGQALDQALGDRSGIRRFGHAVVPMDEARAAASIDVSGRPFAFVVADWPDTPLGGFEPGLLEEFVRGLANHAKLTVHVAVEQQGDTHHEVEACMKAFARALREAVALDPDERGVPSTKGLL